MQASTFLARALREGERYGQDPYVFLRELAQNGRDAGATKIDVFVGSADGRERIVFSDDGSGMSFDHGRRYLFRLYASSKETDVEAAGHFGVGFWSVLQWRPERIRIESNTGKDAWGVDLDQSLTTADQVTCAMKGSGTRISLERTAQPDSTRDGKSFVESVEARLKHYCRYLRRPGRKRQRLPVLLNRQRIDEEMAVDGPFSLRFSSRAAEGVVGLGPEPRVELYSRGLLVTTVSFLEELESNRQVPAQPQNVGGLSPVVLLNSDNLDVVLSRRAPVQSRELRKLVKLGRARVRRLVAQVVDRACPRPWHERLRDGVERVLQEAGGAATVAVLGIWVVVLAAAIGLLFVPIGSSPPVFRLSREPTVASQVSLSAPPVGSTPRPYTNITGYRGATVDVPDFGGQPWGLTYRGNANELLFKSLTLDTYDHARGLMGGPPQSLRPYPAYRCRDPDFCVEVTLELDSHRGELVLPLPTGYRVEATSLTLDGVPRGDPVYTNDHGAAVFKPRSVIEGALTYRIGPSPEPAPSKLPPLDVELPEAVRARLRALRKKYLPRERARRVTRYITELIKYDISPATARAFAATEGPWLGRVLELNAGDCDVKNGLNVLALRYAGISARMAVGIPARYGRARNGLHAWTEFYVQGRWQSIDASGTPSQSMPVVAGLSPAAPSQPRRPATRRNRRRARPSAPVQVRAQQPAPVQDAPAGEVPPLNPARRQAGTGAPPTKEPPAREAQAIYAAIPAWSGGALGGVALLALLLAMWLRRVRERVEVGEGDRVEQRALARILKDALTAPTAWKGAAHLWRRRVLPTVRGRRMSIAEAIERAREGALWMTRRHSTLALEAAGAGTPVLDGAHPVFGEVIATLGRGVDLDSIDALQPATHHEELAALLALGERLLHKAGLDVSCRVAPGLKNAPVCDVDLSGLSLPRGSKWPRRFIAVNPNASSVRERASLLVREPRRGTFVWMDWLLDRSALLTDRATDVRRAAAHSALGDES